MATIPNTGWKYVYTSIWTTVSQQHMYNKETAKGKDHQ